MGGFRALPWEPEDQPGPRQPPTPWVPQASCRLRGVGTAGQHAHQRLSLTPEAAAVLRHTDKAAASPMQTHRSDDALNYVTWS